MKKIKSFKKALHACIRRLPEFIEMPDENKIYDKFYEAKLVPRGFFELIHLLKENKKDRISYKKLALVAIVKNEAPYIEEWIKYYLSLGVESFYIYDNGSKDNLKSKLEEFNDSVTYIFFSGKARQMDAYNDCLNKYGRLYEYMGFIDIDEFIYIKDKQVSLPEYLDSFFQKKSEGGIAINWQIFGSSHIEKKPEGLITNNFLYRAHKNFDANRHVKTIVKPGKVVGFINDPHAPVYLPGYYSVTECHVRIDEPFTQSVSVNDIQINHYFTKSKEEYVMKKDRGQATSEPQRTMRAFYKHDRNDVLDNSLKEYNKRKKLC